MWTLAFGHHEGRRPDARLCRDARGRYGSNREELAAGLKESHRRGHYRGQAAARYRARKAE